MTKTHDQNALVGDMTFVTVQVTPAVAIEWLKLNFENNRSINKAAVARFAEDMKAGAWRLSHQGIAFDDQGRLVDGQHRLRAVIESGATVEMLIVYYKKAPPLTHLDRGTTRSLGAVLEVSGAFARGQGASVASTVNSLVALVRGAIVRRVTEDDIHKIYAAHKTGIDFATSLLKPGKITAPFAAAIAYTHPICPQRIESFAVQAINNDGLAMHSGAWHFSRLMSECKSQTHAQRLVASQAAVKCVMLHMQDREVKTFRTSVEGALDGMSWAEKERQKLRLCVGLWPEVAS